MLEQNLTPGVEATRDCPYPASTLGKFYPTACVLLRNRESTSIRICCLDSKWSPKARGIPAATRPPALDFLKRAIFRREKMLDNRKTLVRGLEKAGVAAEKSACACVRAGVMSIMTNEQNELKVLRSKEAWLIEHLEKVRDQIIEIELNRIISGFSEVDADANIINNKLDILARRYDEGEFRGPGEYRAAITAAITGTP